MHALLYKPGTFDKDGKPLGRTDSVHNSMLVTVDPERKPYQLELAHTEFDPNDPCPVYDFHIAVKPLRYVPVENLHCMGYQLPPTHVEVTEKTTKVDTSCAFSADLLDANANEHGIVDYEIIIEMPHSDYYVDIEMKNDFLTGNFRMQMFAEDDTGHWHKIAHSTWFDEHSFEDVEM